jgi:polysaccharide export outer membrane protein
MAGGLTPVADRRRATLERIKEGVSREVLELSLGNQGLSLPVKDGDLLQVLTITPRFESTVTLRGNVTNPGRFPWKPGMRLRDIIPDKESLVTRDYWKKRNVLGYVPADETAAADPASEAQKKPKSTGIPPGVPDINWSYAVIERQNPQDLLTKLIPFNLGKLIQQNDESQNLELRSGDVVTIFSQGDIRVPQMQQTRTIRLEGEFNAPGVYNVGPGETLGPIIQKAGGLTPQAYLFGSEFLRESVRRDQQKRLDQYIQDLEKEIEQTATNRLGTASSAEESAALALKIQNQRQVVQRLRSVQATGRIVLDLEPNSNDISGIANMSLEDQDRFVVPPRPATVQVIGEVYNSNAFMHTPDQRVADYLRQAGGPTRNADESRMYIMQADGTVLPRQDRRFGLFKANFTNTKLNPGDAIVVPEHVLKTTFMGELREWSQIFWQFGLTAAAINVLR